MAWTPGSSQLPLTPNKQWLYIAHPYTDSILGDAAKENSLLCYAKAQGYTGLFLYELNYYKATDTTFTTSAKTKFQNFILKAYGYGIEIGGAFGSPGTILAICDYNNGVGIDPTKSFTTIISELEWWNYSYNLPFQKPGSTGANGEGAYSTFDTINMFLAYYGNFVASGLKLYTYNGWTKVADYEYTSGFEIIASGPDYVTIKGNYTTSGPDIEDNFANGSKLFQANQVIRLENFPVSGQYTLYKLDATNPTTLVSGNTRLKVGAGRIVSGATITPVTGITGLSSGSIISKWVSTYTDGGGNVISELFLKTSVAHGITPGTGVIYNNVPSFTGLGPQTATARNADNTGTGSPIATGGTIIKVLSPVLPIISSVAATGGIAIATCSISHNLQTGDQVQISGISNPAGLVGLKTVTVLNATEFQYSVGPAINIAQTAVSGSFQVTTMASQATPRLVTPNGTYQSNFPVTGKVRAMLEIVSVTSNPALPNPHKIINLRGNKLEFVYSTTSLWESLRSYKVSVSEYNTGSGVINIVQGSGIPIPTYDSVNNITKVPVAFSFNPSSPKMSGFVEGMANFDIVANQNGLSELQAFRQSDTIEVFALHDYVTTPNYGYVDTRTTQLGQSTLNTKVSWIVSAESAYSANFFEGKDSNGNLLYSPKTPIDAYKYITVPLVNPSPPQSSPASTETDSDVQTYISVDGIVVFKDNLIRALNSGDGPNIFVTAGADVNTMTNPGSVSLPVTFCDDCLPAGTTYTVTWNILSQPGGGVITGGTYTTSSCGPSTSSTAALNYTQAGVYQLKVTVTESGGGTGTGEDTMTVTVGTSNEPLQVTISRDGPELQCSNAGSASTYLTAYSTNPSGVTTPVLFPVTFVWSGPNGYTNTLVDSSPSNPFDPNAASVSINNIPAGVYTVTATDSNGRTGTFTYTLSALYDLSQVFTLATYPPACNRGSDGYAEVLFTPYATTNNYCSLNYANFTYNWSRGQDPLSFNNPSTLDISAGPISVTIIDCHGCVVTLSGTIASNPQLVLNATVTSNAVCGNKTGTIEFSVTGGVPNYYYQLFDSASTIVDVGAGITPGTTTTITSLDADTYLLGVCDNSGGKGCCAQATLVIENQGTGFTLTGPVELTACSCESVTIEVSLDSGTPSGPYTVTWDPGTLDVTSPSDPDWSATATYTFDCNSRPGIHQVTSTWVDANGCSDSWVTIVNVVAPITPVTGINQVFTPSSPLTSCTGSYLELFVQGGTGINGYWEIAEIPSYETTDVNAFNDSGAGTVIDLNWWDTYYSGWQPGDTLTFTWTEFDINGCESFATITITAPQTITIEANVTAVPCNSPDPEVGAIDVTVLTGCPPYTFDWTGPGGFTSTDEDITALVTGYYTVEITDDSGNTYTESIFVPVQGPEITGSSVGNNCFGGNSANGYINIDVSGGSGSYTYEWTSANYPSFNETTQDISNLANGTYTVVVTDSYDCSTTATYTVENLSADIQTYIYEPSCWAECDGSILLDKDDVGILGTIGDDVSILWEDASGNILNAFTDEIVAPNLCSGNYQVIVTYGNGCTWVREFSLGLNYGTTQITSTVVDFVYGDDESTAAIYINTITGGGGPPYSYSWTGPDGFTSISRDITGLTKPGTYTVTIYTGKSGGPCYITKTFTVGSSCPQFTLQELKAALFKFQCCAGTLAKEYVQLMNVGRPDLSECKVTDLKYLTLAINALSCIDELPDSCLSCEDISNIMSQVAKICDCDCCLKPGNISYDVTYNTETRQLDAQGFNKLTPIYPPYTGNGGGNTTVITT